MTQTVKKKRRQKGNIALMTAITMVPTIGLLGSATDIVRSTTEAARLRSALEGAALAAASLTNNRTVSEVITDYISANLGDSSVRDTLNVNIPDSSTALNKKEVTITATVEVETNFLKLFGIDTILVSARTEAVQSATNVELSMVLDISSSMKGDKLSSLKVAAADFVDQILNEKNIDRTSVNLVPFGGTVNIQDLFANYVVLPSNTSAIVNPDVSQYGNGTYTHKKKGELYNSNYDLPNGLWLFNDIASDECIEYRDEDFDSDTIPLNSRGQVPHFWKWNNFNPWCPQEQSGILLNTNDKEALKNRINGMLLSDGTGMDVGIMWGAKSLSPNWRTLLGGDFSDRPANYSEDTLKVLVLMTDGEITPQYRPADYTNLNVHTNRPTNNDPITSENGNQGDNKNQQETLKKGGSSSSASNNDAVGHFRRICDDLEANNVIIYTIGFKIKEGKLSDTLLGECASSAGHYYFVEDLDIKSAFDSIAASVNSLRIKG